MAESIVYDKSVVRELSRRRVFVFISVFLVLGGVGIIVEESDMFLHAIDDYAMVALAIIALLGFAVWRNRLSLADLRKQNNILTALFVVALIFKLYGTMAEMGDASDFGDEIPLLIAFVLTIANRFV
jgi:hypothetical protein